jgi:glycosyltransferase involved in cell wall biosynthesis
MKILFVVHQYLPRHVTGTEQYARSLALELRRRGHDVHVFAFEPLIQFERPEGFWFERDEVVEGVPVHRCSVHPRFAANRELGEIENPLVAGVFQRWFAAQGFELVHVFHARNLGGVVLAEPHLHGVPVVVHLMDFWFLCPNFILLRPGGELCDGPPEGGFGCIACTAPELAAEVERLDLRAALRPLVGVPSPASSLQPSVARRAGALLGRKDRLFGLLASAQAVIAPSRFLRSVFEAQGFPAGRIELLPYGLDAARFRSTKAHTRGDAAAPADGVRPLRVGYTGSISRHKGVHVAIAAVRAAGPAVELHVHGGLESHPDYTDELRQQAGDDPRIVFHGRFEPTQLGKVLASLDVLVVPSLWYENTPFSVLEALHFGLPVVASRLGGIAEVVANERNGLLFAPGDVDDLRAALLRLAADRPLLRTLAQGVSVPSVKQNVDALLAVYERVQGATA